MKFLRKEESAALSDDEALAEKQLLKHALCALSSYFKRHLILHRDKYERFVSNFI